MQSSYISESTPCGNPLDYYSELSAQTGKEPSTTETRALPTKSDTNACLKLQEAINLSMPGNKRQNDKKALIILKDLKHSGKLSKSDQRFNDMLLQHVSQRQNLRNMIDTQDKRLKKTKTQLDKTETQLDKTETQLDKTETQIDQLQHIEAEIDKKERSVTSPIDE
jgi:septal ring factor EnvC (AmiA/AmiB activator)